MHILAVFTKNSTISTYFNAFYYSKEDKYTFDIWQHENKYGSKTIKTKRKRKLKIHHTNCTILIATILFFKSVPCVLTIQIFEVIVEFFGKTATNVIVLTNFIVYGRKICRGQKCF